MSGVAGDTEALNIREQIARIDRSFDEAAKFRSERAKLDAEAAKLLRDRVFMPWQVVATMMGASAAIFGAGAAFWKVIGG